MSTYNKVAGALDESRALLAEVMAELTAAAERERVLREALTGVLECFEHGDKWTKAATKNVIAHMRAALEATK